MTINFKLGPLTKVDPSTDDMSRMIIGWSERQSPQETYEMNRGVWLLGTRAQRERYATFSHDGQVKVAVRIDGLEEIPSKVAGARSKSAIIGHVLDESEPAFADLISLSVDGHRNPVTYLDEPGGAARTCACGCGAPVGGSRAFLPGHDQRAVHERIAQEWGTTLDFIIWFDATYRRGGQGANT